MSPGAQLARGHTGLDEFVRTRGLRLPHDKDAHFSCQGKSALAPCSRGPRWPGQSIRFSRSDRAGFQPQGPSSIPRK